MRVAIFGATGFVGNYLVRALLAAAHEPSVLVRPGSENKLVERDRCRTTSGDIGSGQAIRATLDGCEAVIYNIGLLKEFPRRGITFEEAHFAGVKRVVEAAQDLGVQRFLLMSANGVRADGTEYQRTKYMAEQYLATTGLDWTVFRPSVLFGDPRGRMEFATQLLNDIVRSQLPAPLFFDGLLPIDAGGFRMAIDYLNPFLSQDGADRQERQKEDVRRPGSHCGYRSYSCSTKR